MEQLTLRSCSDQRNQISSAVVAASALYSASVLERATTLCFLLLQEIRESPRRKQYPVVYRRSVRSLVQTKPELGSGLVLILGLMSSGFVEFFGITEIC